MQDEDFLGLAAPLMSEETNSSSDLVTSGVTETQLNGVHVDPSYIRRNKQIKDTRQRVSEVRRKHLPKDDHKRAKFITHMFVRGHTSPSTKHHMPRYVAMNPRAVSLCKRYVGAEMTKMESDVVKTVRVVSVLKAKKQHKSALAAAQKLAKSSAFSLRKIAKLSNIHLTQLHRYTRPKVLKEKPDVEGESKMKISSKDRARVLRFFKRTTVTLQLPFKRHAKNFYLRKTQWKAYHEYSKERRFWGERVLSKSAVYKILPRKFKCQKRIPYKECLCYTCTNYSLIRDALLVARVKGVSFSITDNVLSSLCPAVHQPEEEIPLVSLLDRRTGKRKPTCKRALKLDSNDDSVTHAECSKNLSQEKSATAAKTKQERKHCLTDFKRPCVFRECSQCGVKRLKIHLQTCNPDLDLTQPVHWRQWEAEWGMRWDKKKQKMVRKKTDESRKEFDGSLGDLLQHYYSQTLTMSKHLFHFRWQGEQFEHIKATLGPRQVLLVMDYAMNYTVRIQDEPQCAMWHRKQVTLHPVVAYYLDPDCGHLVTDEMVLVSDDRQHEARASITYLESALATLQQVLPKIDQVFIFTDNCSGQYKCKTYFALLSEIPLKIEHHYFGANHGKGPADGVIGRLKKELDNAIRSGRAVIHTGIDLTTYCQTHLAIPRDHSSLCQHMRRSYQYVCSIDRSRKLNEYKQLYGSHPLHFVANTGVPGRIVVRENSCFCRFCFFLQFCLYCS